MPKLSTTLKFTYMHVVWLCIAIVTMCVVAYVVFHQCSHKREKFIPTLNTEYVSPLDILPGELSVATCSSENTPYSDNDSRVGFHQSLAHISPLHKTSLNPKNPCELNPKNNAIVPVSFDKSANTEMDNLPLQGFKCVWAKNHSYSGTKNKPIVVNLNISLQMYYTVDSTDYPGQKSFPITLELINKWTTFIPIPATIINPKISHTAKIYSVVITRTDKNHDTVLGIESISLVKYLPDSKYGKDGGWQEFISSKSNTISRNVIKIQEQLSCKKGVYQDTNQNIKGSRIDSGILLFEPMCLISEQSYVKTQNNTPTPQKKNSTSNTNNMVPYPLPCQNSLTATIHYNASGSITHQPSNTKVITIRAYFSKAPVSGKLKVFFANINPNDSTQTDYLTAYVGSNGSINTLAQAFNATNQVPTHNIGVASLTNVQDNVLCEFSIALAEQIDVQSKYVMVMDTDCEVRMMQYIPMYSTRKSSQPITLLQNKICFENVIFIFDDTISLHENILNSVFPHSMIDPDCSIIRFERHPTIAATPMVVCASKNAIAMNDGFMFYGSLLIPQTQTIQNNNQILTLTVSLSSKQRLIFSVTRDGVHLRLGTQSIKYIPLPNQANDYSWYIYIHQDTYCLNVNDAFFKGQHTILRSMYNSGATNQSSVAHAYEPITNIRVQVEPTLEFRSRFVSAITYAPTRDVMNLRREDQLLLDAKAVYIYQQPNNVDLSGASPQSLTQLNLDRVISYDSGVSVQFELVPEHLRMDMYVQNTKLKSSFSGEVHLFENESILVALQKRPTKRPSPQFFYLALYFRCSNKYNSPIILADEHLFTNKHGPSPKIILKYSCYKNMERFCIYNYTNRPELVISKTHQISKQNQKQFRKASFQPLLVNNLIISHRTMSTNCNPFNTSTDCDCSGIINVNPSNQITNFQCFSEQNECILLANSKLNASNQTINGLTEDQCLQTGFNTYGSNMLSAYSDTNGTGTCSISEYPTKIVTDNKTGSNVYMCKNQCDQGERVLRALG